MIGDDERRQKSTKHREAAKSRWEGTGKKAIRRLFERTVDGLNWLFSLFLWLFFWTERKGQQAGKKAREKTLRRRD